MQYTNITWRNGQPYSEMFDDIYYSSNDSEDVAGEAEFSHVFFKNNGLPERWQNSSKFTVAELGFGSGLNCILTIREWLKHISETNQEKCLHYIAIEKYPLSPETISKLATPYPQLRKYYDELVSCYPPAIAGLHTRCLFDNRVVIHFWFMDVVDALKNETLNVDAWYLDGFSPAKNPDMWSQQVFDLLARNSHIGTTCSTYTSAGFVRRNMLAAGFSVSKVSGCGNKREILLAQLNSSQPVSLKFKDKPWFRLPSKTAVSEKKAVIIGAGIAGLSLAYSLVKRGWAVTIIDKHGDVAKEATSNPAPIVYPRLSINNDVDTEFFTAAYFYTLHIFKKLQQQSQQRFWFGDGLLQQMDKTRITQIINKFQFNSDYVSVSDDRGKGKVTVEYPSAGIVMPAVLCDVLRSECAGELNIIKAEITDVDYDGKQWQCLSASQLITQTEILVIANGTRINELALPLDFPIEAIRGQVVELNANASSHKINKTVNAAVHITPGINGKHYLGATYTRNNSTPGVDQNDKRYLLESLNQIFPGMFDEDDYSVSWVGFRTMSKDRVPIVGAIPDVDFVNSEYADIRHGKVNKSYLPAQYLKGLYISAAHGSRGFTSSFLSSQIIVSMIEGEPLPVSKNVIDYLSPSRFILNNLKRR